MSKFKVGDRVSVYSLGVWHGPGFHKGRKGTVYQDQYDQNSSVLVQFDDYEIPSGPVKELRIEVYPQQLRRLRKKAKPEAVTVTREQLAKAWDDQVREDVIDYGSTTFAFREFCEALGFPPTAKKEGV